ncbi:MAG TPA: MHYT domain-containing protein [Xanthobacteraceae bacterium]
MAGLICFLSSLVAFNLFHRARATANTAGWILAAGIAAGSGIWATHFIAMLAYDPGIGIAYDLDLTVLSLIAAAAITSLGLAIAVYGAALWGPALGGGIVGAGVAAMHYTGMSAVELPGHIDWDPSLVAASIVIGMLLGMAALTVAARRADRRSRVAAAVLLTLAIVAHHFMAMGAIEIVPDPTRVIDASSLSPSLLAIAIAGVATAVLSLSLAGAFLDHRVGVQNLRLAAAIDHMSQGLAMFDASARLILVNQAYLKMYGLSAAHAKPGCSLRDLFSQRVKIGTFAGDIDHYIGVVMQEIRERKPVDKTLEMGDGQVYAISNRPMADAGWVSTHQDVTLQLRAEPERDRINAQENRRAAIDAALSGFRERVESLLQTVDHNAITMHRAVCGFQQEFRACRRRCRGIQQGIAQRGKRGFGRRGIVGVHRRDQPAARPDQQPGWCRGGRGGRRQRADRQPCAGGAEDRRCGQADPGRRRPDQPAGAQRHHRGGPRRRCRPRLCGGASELKSLAVQTGKATEEIAGQIAAVQASTSAGVEAIARIADRMRNINQFTAAAAASVLQQSGATGEISQNVASAVRGTKEIMAVLGGVAETATDTRRSAETVLTASEAVETAAADVRAEVEGFLRKVAV